MTSIALSVGCALIAFSPLACMLILFSYSKAQLTIIVTTSAFFQLLACLLSSLLHLPFALLTANRYSYSSSYSAYIIIPTSILSQAIFRMAFVWLYHKVDAVIEQSIHRQNQNLNQGTLQSNNNTNTNTNSNTSSNTPFYDHPDNNNFKLTETAKLRLELNDISCSIAAGTGFGGMRAIMLYGTLLASEAKQYGTLYQSSCTIMPSLLNSAIVAAIFNILDVYLMILCFYGIRTYLGMPTNYHTNNIYEQRWTLTKEYMGSHVALLSMILIHTAAAFSTIANKTITNGCIITFPLLATILLLSTFYVGYYYKNVFLPQSYKRL